jgi:hypothetical protein
MDQMPLFQRNSPTADKPAVAPCADAQPRATDGQARPTRKGLTVDDVELLDHLEAAVVALKRATAEVGAQ